MHFTWIDYPAKYENEIETWCDEFAIRFALDDDSVITEHQWYLDSDKYKHNENYFCKVVLDGDTPVALFMLAIFSDETKKHLTENIVYLDTLIINPALRNQNFGSRIIADVIQNAEQIIGSSSNIFISQIHKDNDVAKKLATKLGFHFVCTEAEKNHNWFDWVYPASAVDRFISYRDKRIVIISGPPGSGKSSVSKKLAEESMCDRAVHMHTDDFYRYIRKGYISPWLSEAHEQNTVTIEAFAASVKEFATGGYEVIVDGVLGPWFLDPWIGLVQSGFDVRYIILRPDEQTTISRAVNREDDTALTDVEAVKHMWQAFSDLGAYESHIIDTTHQDINETVALLQKLLAENAMRLK